MFKHTDEESITTVADLLAYCFTFAEAIEDEPEIAKLDQLHKNITMECNCYVCRCMRHQKELPTPKLPDIV